MLGSILLLQAIANKVAWEQRCGKEARNNQQQKGNMYLGLILNVGSGFVFEKARHGQRRGAGTRLGLDDLRPGVLDALGHAHRLLLAKLHLRRGLRMQKRVLGIMGSRASMRASHETYSDE